MFCCSNWSLNLELYTVPMTKLYFVFFSHFIFISIPPYISCLSHLTIHINTTHGFLWHLNISVQSKWFCGKMCVQCSFQRWHKPLLILRTSFFYLSIAQKHSWMLLAATDIFYITSDSSVSTCLFYCSTSDVYLKNGTGYFKEKKHFIFKENINFWE